MLKRGEKGGKVAKGKFRKAGKEGEEQKQKEKAKNVNLTSHKEPQKLNDSAIKNIWVSVSRPLLHVKAPAEGP